MSVFSEKRRLFHEAVSTEIVRLNGEGIPNFADASSNPSSKIAALLYSKMSGEAGAGKITGQTAGKRFEQEVSRFVQGCFKDLGHLRPGLWEVGRKQALARFEQYNHLTVLSQAVKESSELAAVLGSDYVIKPDIVVWRNPESDEAINRNEELVDDRVVRLAPLREKNQQSPILHASISCKWTIRSDRSQNSRTEALNLVRNRKGRLAHIVVVTAEPLPSRIASIALGTGDIDCTYHLALPELRKAVHESGYEDAEELLETMVQGKRLRDISDLVLDLAV